MANRPFGRQKNVTGQGKKVGRRGEGLGTGPVGNAGGYHDRPTAGGSGRRDDTFYGGGSEGSGSGTTRGLGGKGLIAIIIAVVMLLGGGGLSGLFGNLLGGGSGGASSSSGGGLLDLGGVLGNLFGGGSSVSSDWTAEKNTGKLDRSVAPSARDKRTVIYGDGKDQVTVMVYLCGTDLESKNGMASSDLQEMCNAALSSKVNLLVYTGGCKNWKNNTVSNSKNQIYKVENRNLRCLVKDDGSASMTKPATLTGFINYCTKNYPANRYMLIFWDHGGGSLSGYGYDEKNSSSGSMTLSGINEALKKSKTVFDFIGFDTCLMATAENALMLSEYADYMIASEETEPGIGWYYTDWLTALSKNTSMPTLEIGQKIVDDFVEKCNTYCAGQKATLSVIDLAELEATAPQKLKDFAASTSALIRSDNYQAVSDARCSTKEFSASNKIDQVDLIHLAYNMGTDEGKALAETLLGAVKYNKTSSNVSNAYGLSIYFPYQRTSKVDSAVATYEAIGMDSEYARCIQEFASLEVAGQAASGGQGSPIGSLLGSLMGGESSSGSSGGGLDIGSILGGLMSGSDLFGVSGLTSGNSGFLGRGLSMDSKEYLETHRFDASALVWEEKNGQTQLTLSDEQWVLVHDLELNVFMDDGEGFIDLGLDNVFEFTDDGALLGEYDGTWLAIDSQPVAYYYESTDSDGTSYTITGRVPVLINGERANLILVFDNAHPYGYIAGARYDYVDGETETIAKGLTALTEGDRLDFLCDYYSYEGEYIDSYMFGDPMNYRDGMQISNVYLDAGSLQACYRFTDIYNQYYWTPVLPD
ncbi:MAG: peptidase C11 [Oscillospiraceae bacterium]|nr:peptidase C11 [Oscillospiraceae bacterium]